MYESNQKFLERLNITDTSSIKIYREKDINPLACGWRVINHKGISDVPVSNILGSNLFPGQYNTLLQALDYYFKDDNYFKKFSLLKSDVDSILERIKRSFKNEPICVTEIDEGKYVISVNGIHRYIILKLLYLSELGKASREEEVNLLNEKYTIPCDVDCVDLDISYAIYFLNSFDFNGNIKDVMTDYDKNNRQNGGIRIRFTDGTERGYTKEQALRLVMEFDNKANYLDISSINSGFISNISRLFDSILSFKEFVSKYCPNLANFVFENSKDDNIQHYEKIIK